MTSPRPTTRPSPATCRGTATCPRLAMRPHLASPLGTRRPTSRPRRAVRPEDRSLPPSLHRESKLHGSPPRQTARRTGGTRRPVQVARRASRLRIVIGPREGNPASRRPGTRQSRVGRWTRRPDVIRCREPPSQVRPRTAFRPRAAIRRRGAFRLRAVRPREVRPREAFHPRRRRSRPRRTRMPTDQSSPTFRGSAAVGVSFADPATLRIDSE